MMLFEKERDVAVTVKKLTMVSLVEVFKDIAPGYRIREWGDKAKSVEVGIRGRVILGIFHGVQEGK